METGSLRVMTFNIRHGRGLNDKVDLAYTADEIARSGAQVVALQEVDRFNIRSYCRDQVRWLAKKLNMHWCFSTSLRFGFTRYGNAVLSVFPQVCKRVVSMPGSKENRTVMEVQIDTDERRFYLINTHLAVSGADRRKQFPLLTEMLVKVNGPAILMGDFNMEIDNRIFMQLAPDWKRIKPAGKTATVQGGQEIDHIFVNRDGVAAKAWVQHTAASDHHAVLADISWRQFTAISKERGESNWSNHNH